MSALTDSVHPGSPRLRWRPALEEGLPAFRCDSEAHARETLLWVPGEAPRRVPRAVADGLSAAGEGGVGALADELRRAAARALDSWQRSLRIEAPFEPECLTLIPTSRCNLGCVYCHTDAGPGVSPRLDPDAVARAAARVADACAHKGREALTVVVHGGGEPTLAHRSLDGLLDLCARAARARQLRLWTYLSTHGAHTESVARWVAERFDRVSLSVDGPPEIQDVQRPGLAGGPTSARVLATARLLRESGTAFGVRVTATEATVGRLPDVVRWLIQQLGPDEVRIEPLYSRGRAVGASGPAARPPAPGAFVDGFLEAAALGRSLGVPVRCSLVRLDELHGPFCHTQRQVLALTPDGLVTGCFDATRREADPTGRLLIGAAGVVDPDRLARHHAATQRMAARCTTCFNRYHCARECPDRCAVRGDLAEAPGPRCEIAAALADRSIRARAGWEAKS